jgi:NAD(P)-dependent dehydrogenase (short-subunit alcohol dehydrogenase family)
MSESAHKGVVVITGAAGGIGRAAAHALTARGYRVYAGFRARHPALSTNSGISSLRRRAA